MRNDFCSSFSCLMLLEGCAHFVLVIYYCRTNNPQTKRLKTFIISQFRGHQEFRSSLVGWFRLYIECWQRPKLSKGLARGLALLRHTELAAGLKSPRPKFLTMWASLLAAHYWLFPSDWSKRGRNQYVFCNLVSAATCHQFAVLLVI